MKQDTTQEGKKRYWVRQSWLNDVMICPERARLGVVMPEWRQSSDATHIGTAVHAGIEHILLGYEGDPTATASNTLEKLIAEEPFRINSTSGVDDMRMYTQILMETFNRDILPSVKKGGMVERTFGVKLFDTTDAEVWLGGTIDYVDPDGVIWDWKTAARRYSQGEKQRQSIQATAYAYACAVNGWSSMPVRFNYGVMTRTTKSAGQIVPIVRTQQHVDWFISQVESVVQPFSIIGLDNRWMANDQHGLCSEKWCPFWSICKGSRISDQDNNPEEVEQ